MGRQSSKIKNSPTASLRLRAWTRTIKGSLLPNTTGDSSGATLIRHAIDTRQWPKQIARLIGDGSSSVPISSWSNWWKGQSHPDPKRVEFFDIIVPGTALLLNTEHEAIPTDTFLVRLFHAIDLYSKKESRQLQLHALLASIQRDWVPVRSKGPTAKWHPKAFPDIEVTTEVLLGAWRTLEPASVLPFLMQLADVVGQSRVAASFERWRTDVLITAISVYALLSNRPSEFGHGGRAEDAASFVLFSYLDVTKAAQMLGQATIGHFQSLDQDHDEDRHWKVLPETPTSLATIRRSSEDVRDLLQRYDIAPEEIAKLL